MFESLIDIMRIVFVANKDVKSIHMFIFLLSFTLKLLYIACCFINVSTSVHISGILYNLCGY